MISQIGTDRIIRSRKYELARLITEKQLKAHPEMQEEYGEKGRIKCFEDSLQHLENLAQSLRSGNPEVYTGYVEWAQLMLESRKKSSDDLANILNFVQESCSELLENQQVEEVRSHLQEGVKRLKQPANSPLSVLAKDNPFLPHAKKYLSLLIEGERIRAKQMIDELIDEGMTIRDINEYIFEASQHEVGRLWQTNVISIAHEHYCSAATQLMMARLFPALSSSVKISKKLVSCSVAGDMHEIGIRMVTDFFEMAGWDTYFMGAGMPAEELIDVLHEQNADLFAISTTIPAYLNRAEDLISSIRSDRELNSLRILIGGYTFVQYPDSWQQTGADLFAANAREAVSVAGKLNS